MRKVNAFFIVFVLLFSLNNFFLSAQTPEMTYEEMNKDFSYLMQMIRETDPHILIREKVTGVPIYCEMERLRDGIDSVRTFEDFYYILHKVLALTQDMHNEFDYLLEFENKFSSFSKEITDYCYENYDRFRPGSHVKLSYIDGKYYYMMEFWKKDSTHLLPGTRILSVNDVEIDNYIKTYNRFADPGTKWDAYHKKHYAYRVYSFPDHHLPEVIDLTCNYKDSLFNIRYAGGTISGGHRDYYEHKVHYFDTDRILYLRVPEMDSEFIPFYKENIIKYRNQPVNKVIIDIRGNDGGNDRVWYTILSLLLDEPVSFKTKLAFKNTETVKNQYTRIFSFSLDSINQLPVAEYLSEEFFVIEQNEVIESCKESINYKGNIYLLVDGECFSSALALSSVAKQTERLVTVGQPTGMIGGRGVMAFHFSLPYSGLIFKINPALDLSYITTTEDFYDTKVDIPVPLEVDDAVFEYQYKGERLEKEFLYHHDPVFRKVLELPN